jgi:CSLREA domain-containing protein
MGVKGMHINFSKHISSSMFRGSTFTLLFSFLLLMVFLKPEGHLLALAGDFNLLSRVQAQSGSTFSVNAVDDVNDNECTAQHCSLREAILAANEQSGLDTVQFNLVGTAPFSIGLISPLPQITDPVIINATTQPGYNDRPLIELNGSLAGSDANGLTISANNSTIRGLAINRFDGTGIVILVVNNSIFTSYLGTDTEGWVARGNDIGLSVAGDGNTIGSLQTSDRNVISANRIGIEIRGSNNTILGSMIGTDRTGVAAHLGNIDMNVYVSGSAAQPAVNNQIGAEQGEYAGYNEITYSLGPGIVIEGASSVITQVNILNNFIYSNYYLSTDHNVAVIDLLPAGSTANDPGDLDNGPNGLQNFPIITDAWSWNSEVTINGTLDSKPNTPYTIQFYESGCGASGIGQAQWPVDSLIVTTNATGFASFQVVFDRTPLSPGIIATATGPEGTSELSRCYPITNAPSGIQLLAPENGISINQQQPILRWQPVPGVTGYTVWLGRTLPPTHSVQVNTNSYRLPYPLLYETYYWRVGANGLAENPVSETWSISITAPQNASTEPDLFVTGWPTISWSPVSWATRYEFEISPSPIFAQTVFYYHDEVPANQLRYTVPDWRPPFENGRYYWRVRAKNALGKWQNWSGVQQFMIAVP